MTERSRPFMDVGRIGREIGGVGYAKDSPFEGAQRITPARARAMSESAEGSTSEM